jgi:HAD superfamily hydrolase (TIGR01549 family)
MIRALIFDCFGLFYVDSVITYADDASTPPEKAEVLRRLDEQASRDMVTKPEFIERAAGLLGIPKDEADERFFHSNERDDRLLAFVQELRKTYKVGMLSNIGGDMMDGFFSHEERKQLFDVVILSGDVGIAKPDRAIFELMCKRLGVALDEAVMIDDSKNTCAMVKTYGMQSVCYKDFDQCKHDLARLLK